MEYTNFKWVNEALCSKLIKEGELPETLWIDEDNREGQEVAKSVCLQCSVKIQCLSTAKDLPVTAGIWGGVNFSSPLPE